MNMANINVSIDNEEIERDSINNSVTLNYPEQQQKSQNSSLHNKSQTQMRFYNINRGNRNH